ncbi:phage gp6-like head-tail connector protein [Acinetobacter baumannii]|uniref:Phage gp6-like head-tail connector protein n=1 Tax=Acinetobacter baumannii TaxID=470 RepID=A0A6B2QKB2_ACIBA|nr:MULTISPECIES: head-tail connector protein [Acinetobacter]AIS05573.1 phage head-tail adapter protein [Acinetobacter baumannii]MDA3445180.1 head-tail connector protein [Acinetobacter sp. AOR42_HL]MDA3589914.1 head-tail connector protein [Acinetobacter sp. AOR01_HL]MDQ9064308.1 head-tail connector protein [Acinetobacter baumannii]NDN56636.1 phage gp6-like head-tail connector protein [Acinetobacter baumannii]
MSITDLATVKAHLRYDSNDNDLELEAYREAAEQAVLDYVTDEFADGNYPKQFKVAVLLLCGYYDSNRNLENGMMVDGNYLPPPVRALLYKFRDPTAI